jgi:hypothetical protein
MRSWLVNVATEDKSPPPLTEKPKPSAFIECHVRVRYDCGTCHHIEKVGDTLTACVFMI